MKTTKAAPQSTRRAASAGASKSKALPKRNTAGRPTADELERRKAKVMQIATSLFVKQGYAATSLVDIAKGAGVATRTLYQHFGDKEAIFRDVMYARDTAAVFPPPEISDDETLFDVMMRTAQYACEVTFRKSTVELMRLAIGESKRFPDMMRKLIDISHERFRANIEAIFEELASRSAIREADTRTAADMFIHLVLGDTPLMVIAGWKAPVPSEAELSQKVELFIQGRWGETAAKAARNRKIPTAKTRQS